MGRGTRSPRTARPATGERVTARRPERGRGPSPLRTPLAERILHHAAALTVGLSGLAYAWMKYLTAPPENAFSVVNHPLQPTALHLHVLSAPVLVFAVGILWRDHVWARLRNSGRRRGRASGTALTLLLVPMIASGYLLQTTTSEALHTVLVGTHLVTGGAWLVGYAAHAVSALRPSDRWRRDQTAARGGR